MQHWWWGYWPWPPAAIVVVDRASLSLFPGPDFNPAMVLR